MCSDKSDSKDIKSKYQLHWQQTDTTVALLNHEHIVWQFNFSKREGRPYFYPLALMDGTILTSLRPKDHVHQRSLYFSWKYINGINYYDPDDPPGKTVIKDVQINRRDDFSAKIKCKLDYRPENQPVVLSEHRTLLISPPNRDGYYYIDWTCEFTAHNVAVELNRTPITGQPGGKSWGGYAGLILRMRSDYINWSAVNDSGLTGKTVHGKKAQWLDVTLETPDNKTGGVTLFDHPDNKRHPNEWLLHENAIEDWPGHRYLYITTGFVYSQPYTIPANGQLTLRYRTLVHQDQPDITVISKICKSYKK
jgi:hypothetical protein